MIVGPQVSQRSSENHTVHITVDTEERVGGPVLVSTMVVFVGRIFLSGGTEVYQP